MLVLCNLLRKWMVSDKKIYRAFRTQTLFKQKALEKLFIFNIYQNSTLALIITGKTQGM